MSNKKPRSVSFDHENLEWLDENVRNRSGFINELLEEYRKNEGRIEEAIQEFRAEQLLEEADDLESAGEQKMRKAERKRKKAQEYLKASESTHEQTSVELSEARDALSSTPKDPTNPAIKAWASDLGMTPVELVEQLTEEDE